MKKLDINNKYNKLNIKLSLPKQAENAIGILEFNGFEAYAVGGCVRDAVMGKKPADWDICTNCKPQKLKDIFGEYRITETGIKHGTITVVIDGLPLEITTFRYDSDYCDHRHPNAVEYISDLNDDLSRRDFTVNALAYNKKTGIIDRFGGLSDIKNKIIRCVGDPELRFEEDALRILRAARFSSTLSFSIEPKTKSALLKKIKLLDFVSAERIREEFLKLLTGENVLNILLEFKELIFHLIPELGKCDLTPQNTPHHCYNVYEHIAHSVANINPEPELRLVMLLHDIGKPETMTTDEQGTSHFKMHPDVSKRMSEVILNRLKLPKNDIKYICKLISQHDNRFPAQEKPIKRFLSNYGEYFFEDYIKIRLADTFAQSEYMREEKLNIIMNVKIIGENIIKSNEPLQIKDLDISGDDLLKLGLCGKQIGEMLNKILDAVLDNKIPNTKSELIKFTESNLQLH